MNLTGWRFLAFALTGAAAIIILASIGTPTPQRATVDRHTGERVVVVKTIADALFEARMAGDAQAALAAIAKRREQFPGDPVLSRYESVFALELGGDDLAVPDAHPYAELVRAERRRAEDVRRELRERAGEKLHKQELLALLVAAGGAESIGRANEEFFGPLTKLKLDRTRVLGPDERAARILARLESAPAESADPYLAVASDFRAHARARGRLRWLLRAYAALPDRPVELVRAYVETGRLVEALLVTGAALRDHDDDVELWEARATYAGWLSLPHEEAEAQQVLLERGIGDAKSRRERLIQLFTYMGRPERAVPHALALAEGSTDKTVLERPVRLALDAGDVDRALELLEDLAEASDEPAYWREKIVLYAWQNFRVDRVVAELDTLRRKYPDGDYEARLERIYRRRNRMADLAALLDERLQREPGNADLEREVLALHAGLGNEARAKEILLARIDRDPDPRRFFANVTNYVAMDLPGIPERAAAAAGHADLAPEDFPAALDALRLLFDVDPAYRGAANALARRFAGRDDARQFLLDQIDAAATPERRAEAAAALAADFADDPAFVRAWIDRASWAGLPESELRAREAWRKHAPDDHENKRALADLYATVGRPEEALVYWRELAERDGPTSDAALQYVDALFATGDLEAAMALLEKRANHPDATLADRLAAAEQLFGNRRLDRALRFYDAVLAEEPDHALALLRTGQVRAWTNDPRGAIPFYERRLEVTDELGAEVRFYLGEAHWSVGENGRGARYQREALPALEAVDPRTPAQDLMIARMLARLGRLDEAIPVFDRVLAGAPDEIDVVLDYADAMVAAERAARARELVARARELAPRNVRALRLDGRVAMLEKRYLPAARAFEASLARSGPEAGAESEMARALELTGDRRSAREAYRRSLALQPGNLDVATALHDLDDLLADFAQGTLTFRDTGDDSLLEVRASGSLLLKDDRTRVDAELGVARFVGRAAAVDLGATDVEETALRLRASVFHRFRDRHVVAGGLEAYPGASGDLPVGGWFGAHWTFVEPFAEVGARAHVHLLLDDPAAAAGLGGRTSGLELFAQRDLGQRFFAGGSIAYESLSVEPPGAADASDGRFRAAFTFGVRLLEGRFAVADPHRVDDTRGRGILGPSVEGAPPDGRGPAWNAWISWQPIRLLDDKSLAALIPIGERFDYLSVGSRYDVHFAEHWGAKLEGFAGADLQDGDLFFGAEGGVTWRPARARELTLVAGYGRAAGRDDDTNSFHFRFTFTWRW